MRLRLMVRLLVVVLAVALVAPVLFAVVPQAVVDMIATGVVLVPLGVFVALLVLLMA